MRNSENSIKLGFNEHLLCILKVSEEEDKALFFFFNSSECVWSAVVVEFPWVARRVILEHLSMTSVFVAGWGVTALLMPQHSEAPRDSSGKRNLFHRAYHHESSDP